MYDLEYLADFISKMQAEPATKKVLQEKAPGVLRDGSTWELPDADHKVLAQVVGEVPAS